MSDCQIEPTEKPLDEEALKGAMFAYLGIEGIGCPRCVIRVSNSLLRLDGVLLCKFFESIAVVAYDPQQVTIHDLMESVAAAGYDRRHSYRASFIDQAPADEAIAYAL